MDEKRFEELFTDVERWIYQARRLKIAGDQLVQAYESLLKRNLLDRDGVRQQNLWALKGGAYYLIGNDEEGDKSLEKAGMSKTES